MSENNFSATITTDGRPLDQGRSYLDEELKYSAPKGYLLNAVNLPSDAEIVITVEGKETYNMKQAAGSSRFAIDEYLPKDAECDPGVLVQVVVKVNGRVKATTKYRFSNEPEEWKVQRRQLTDEDNSKMLSRLIDEFTKLADSLTKQRSVIDVSEFRSVDDTVRRIVGLIFRDFHMSGRSAIRYLFEKDAWELLDKIGCAYWFCRAVVESAKNVPDGMTPITRNAVEKGLTQLYYDEKVAEQLSQFPPTPRDSIAIAKLVESGLVLLKPAERVNRGESQAEWTFIPNPALLEKLPALSRW